MIEPIPDDDRHLLVTFLWRGDESTENIVLIGSVAGTIGFDFHDHQFTRLDSTDLWYRSYRVRHNARFTYHLSVNDPLTTMADLRYDEAEFGRRCAGFQLDPLNQYPYPVAPNVSPWTSTCELPHAPPQPWITRLPGLPRGQVEQFDVRSDILETECQVWVYTPPDYRSECASYPLMLVFDGAAYRHLVPVPTILDNLAAEHRERTLPIPVTVFVGNVDGSRTEELGCNTDFITFLDQELLPWIAARYAITTDPRQTIVAGSSLGGLTAAFAAFQLPGRVGKVLSQSGAYFWPREFGDADFATKEADGDIEFEWLTRQWAQAAHRGTRFWIEAGRLEMGRHFAKGPSILAANRHLRTVLRAKGYAVSYHEFVGGHDYLSWRGTFGNGVMTLLSSGPADVSP